MSSEPSREILRLLPGGLRDRVTAHILATELACREPETWPFYYAVLRLRRAGHRVFRAGDMTHLLDGRRVARPEILRAAAALKRDRKEAEHGR